MNEYESHPGGNQQYRQDDIVEQYEYQQSLVSEKKDESLFSIVRVINYFRYLYAIDTPVILDIGCGPGTANTLSNYLLEQVPNSYVAGVDSSEQMIRIAEDRLVSIYGQRFGGIVGDFNSDNFWVPALDRKYHFITSFASLHYLSDRRMYTFLKEIRDHLDNNGIFIAGLGNRSTSPRIAEMENQFRIEFTYNQLDAASRPADFSSFKAGFEETDSKANVNWHSYRQWLEVMEDVGFSEVDVIWHLWVRSIFLAVK